MSTLNFKNAVADYRFLKNRRYPDKAALKLVGDRYRLSATGRNCLLRGVVTDRLSRARLAKKISGSKAKGRALGIDWFNVLITLESYLKGAVLFLADDGVLRDSSAVHGSYRPGSRTPQAINLMWRALVDLRPRRVDVFIDSPISHSKEMCDRLAATRGAAGGPFPCSFTLVKSADYPLKAYPDVVASSDSVILDHCPAFVDLARLALESFTKFRVIPLEKLNL
jgi:hypothetical protein